MQTTTSSPDVLDLLTLDDVARLLRLSKVTVYRLVERGLFPVYRLGRRLRFSRVQVAEYLRRMSHNDYGGSQD
jgi:excisionase family DNA binding protein